MADAILEDAAERYNIPLGVLEGLAATEAQSWSEVAPGEGSVGRFQIHPIHAQTLKKEYGVTMEQLRWRPDIQVAFMVPKYAEIWNSAMTQGKGAAQAAWNIVHLVQKPAEQYRQGQIQSILQHLGGEVQMAGEITGATSAIPPEINAILEEQWAAMEARARADYKAEPFKLESKIGATFATRVSEEEFEGALEGMLAGSYLTKDAWKLSQLGQYGVSPTLGEEGQRHR